MMQFIKSIFYNSYFLVTMAQKSAYLQIYQFCSIL